MRLCLKLKQNKNKEPQILATLAFDFLSVSVRSRVFSSTSDHITPYKSCLEAGCSYPHLAVTIQHHTHLPACCLLSHDFLSRKRKPLNHTFQSPVRTLRQVRKRGHPFSSSFLMLRPSSGLWGRNSHTLTLHLPRVPWQKAHVLTFPLLEM